MPNIMDYVRQFLAAGGAGPAGQIPSMAKPDFTPMVGQTPKGTYYPDIGPVGNMITGNRVPSVDLAPINVSKAPPTVIPQAPQAVVSSPEVKPAGSNKWMQALLAMGVPLGAIIAASAGAPLPAMAGLSKGYGEGIQTSLENKRKQEELDIKKNPRFAQILDSNGNVINTVQIGAKDIVKMKNAGIDFNFLNTPTSETTKETVGRVTPQFKSGDIREKDGKKYQRQADGTWILL